MDMVPSKGFDLDDGDKLGLGGSWHSGHNGVNLGSIGVVEWAGIVFAEPGMLDGMRTVDFVGLREKEPKMVEGFSRDKFELRKSVLVGGGPSEICHKGVNGCLGWEGRPQGGNGVVETSWHC
jgi:hypothetical protein